MHKIKLSSYGFHCYSCFLVLGSIYKINNANLCMFFKGAGKKGFNFLNIETFRCFFPHNIYQVDSINKKVSLGQKTFQMAIPKTTIHTIVLVKESALIEDIIDIDDKIFKKAFSPSKKHIVNSVIRLEI